MTLHRGKCFTDKPFALPDHPFANHVRRLALPSSATARGERLEIALGPTFLYPLELYISIVRRALRHRITCYSRWGICMSSRDTTMHTFSRCPASGSASTRSAFRHSCSSRIPLSSKPLWPSPANVLKGIGCERSRSLAGQNWRTSREHCWL